MRAVDHWSIVERAAFPESRRHYLGVRKHVVEAYMSLGSFSPLHQACHILR
jgi:hypothetical protein